MTATHWTVGARWADRSGKDVGTAMLPREIRGEPVVKVGHETAVPRAMPGQGLNPGTTSSRREPADSDTSLSVNGLPLSPAEGSTEPALLRGQA